MKKLTLIAVSFMLTAFSFAQNQGQWSFGAGGDFTAPDANANIGYFVMDGLMMSFDFEMGMDYEAETCCTDDASCEMDHSHEHVDVEGEFSWGGAIRYYAVDNMFVEAGMRMGDGDDPDTHLAGGVSLELGFDGKLWFEPMLKYNMPGLEVSSFGSNESQSTLGLAWSFRYTF